MKQDKTRYITLKIHVNEEEDALIRRNLAGRSISATGRHLLLTAQQPAHRIRRRRPAEGTRLGPSLSDMFPSRRGGAPIPLPLRL